MPGNKRDYLWVAGFGAACLIAKPAWAKDATSIDPLNLAATPAPQCQPAIGCGERATGAVRDAVVGGIIHSSDGAAKGAGVGIVAGGAKARQNQRSRQVQQSSQQQNQINTFYRAHSAYMEGRGYSVK